MIFCPVQRDFLYDHIRFLLVLFILFNLKCIFNAHIDEAGQIVPCRTYFVIYDSV